MGTCPNLGDALVETVALVFDVASHETGQLPKRIEQLLSSPQVRAAVEKQLLARAKDLVKKQQGGFSVAALTPQQFLEPVAGSVKDLALRQTKETIKKSPEYKRLMMGVENLKCAMKATPVGVWVDKHETLVVLILSAVALGGATVMYTTKSGDSIAKPSMDLIKAAVKKGKIGSLEFKLAELKFVPSAQTVKAGVEMTPTSWTRYKTTFSFRAEVKNGKATSVKAGVNTVVPLTKTISLAAKGSTDPVANMHTLMLRVSHQQKGFSLGVMGAFDFEGGTTSGSVGSSLNYTHEGVTAGASVSAGVVGKKKGERVYSTFLRFEL